MDPGWRTQLFETRRDSKFDDEDDDNDDVSGLGGKGPREEGEVRRGHGQANLGQRRRADGETGREAPRGTTMM